MRVVSQIQDEAKSLSLSNDLILDIWHMGLREWDLMNQQVIDQAALEEQERRDLENGEFATSWVFVK